MLDPVRRRDLLAWASGTLAVAALPLSLPCGSAVSSSASPPPQLSPVFADVMSQVDSLIADYAEARRKGVGYFEADMSLRQLLLRAIEALPKTLDDCDAQKRCEDELIAAIVQPAPYHTPYPRHEQEAL